MYYFKRHGDLLIEKVDSIPKGLQKKENNIILEGEASNHFHRTSTGTLLLPNEAPAVDNNWTLAFLEVETPAEITHEEHKTIILEPGKYKFYRQREWDEQEERAVID
jgi:hypothetical protein